MKINQAKQLIKKNFELALNKGVYLSTLLVSGPGLGKSSIVQQAAAELSSQLGEPVACRAFHLTTVEPPDVRGFGLPDKSPDGKRIMTFTLPPWAVRATDPRYGILFLDELGQASHDVQKPAAELLLHRQVGDYKLPGTEGQPAGDGGCWIVVAASNRDTDRSGVQRELAFITNRRMCINVTPDLDAWAEWAEKNGIHPLAIAFAKFKPGSVFADKIPEKPGAFCTPRSLCMASNLIGEYDEEMFIEAASGLMGEGTAAEFIAFLRVASKVPKFEEIVANPEKTPVPDKPDASFAVMQMISHQVSDKTARAAFKYLKRMPREFQVAGLRGTFHRCPELVRGPEFALWLRENKDLVLQANLMGSTK